MSSPSHNGTNNDPQEPSVTSPPAIDPCNLEEGEISEGEDSTTSSPKALREEVKLKSPIAAVLSRTTSSSAFSNSCSRNSTPDTPRSPDTESMSPDELDRAKSVVLDLLGWGVSPEYLVESGVSTGALYRIFTDLRLRLPANLALPIPPSVPPSSTQ
ncbi:hypothetical protein BV22DRAFT_771256 [Leucogyrophana mollusca]|uniref:Uncharacterized protein n=1 Tax=Leucogyrophana mollusca TaxID=85980 RepID=A0ACB8B6M9_9AGAM|nr:hypothetical protein BV22DRAFT_771256 [Leucogyrophana mollusca]